MKLKIFHSPDPSHTIDQPAAASPDGLVLIGKLAEIASVAPSAIRFYEKEGLLEPRKLGRLRTYSAADANTLRLIVRLRKTGLPINKVREALLHCQPGHRTGQNENLVKIIEKQIEELAQRTG
jgi:MerR family transcriptional regulator, redox-sensitive transcriptional activator SoxR